MDGDEGTPSRRSIPSVDRVLRQPSLRDLRETHDHAALVALTRSILDEDRTRVEGGGRAARPEQVAERIRDRISQEWHALPRPVINATGVILHTNIGRAPLSDDAIHAIRLAAACSDLEIDLLTGERDNRQRGVTSMLSALTGAEAALVTGNNAAAMLLCLTVLAAGREVIVSRGQQVAIGGSFRVPDILRQSGARLVEVGTTNRTDLSDYANAIGPQTAAILHVHPSNFRILGFASSVPLAALARLAHERRILLLDDNGSGPLLDTATYGLDHEPTPNESLESGTDLVTFSGDKLLGGPQAGIVVGRRLLIDAIAVNPLARAVRPDKLSLAALRATLAAYLEGRAEVTLPVWQMIGQSLESIRVRSEEWLQRAAQAGVTAELTEGNSTVGGGALPGSRMPTVRIGLPPSVDASRLRRGSPAVLAVTRGDRVLMDLRTVPWRDEDTLLQAVVAALA